MLKHDKAQLLASKIYCVQIKTVECYGKIWKSSVAFAKVVVSFFFKSVILKDHLTTFVNIIYSMHITVLSDCKYLP